MAASVAAVGLVTGIGFTVAANDAQERVLAANQDLEAARKGTPAGQDVCGGASEPDVCKTVKQRHDEKVTLHNAAVAAYVVGGVAAVGAAGLLIWTLHGGARGSEARVVPVATSRGGGLLVGGTF
jgi:nitrate reductase NapE component